MKAVRLKVGPHGRMYEHKDGEYVRFAEASTEEVFAKATALNWRIFCSNSLNREAKTPFGDYVIQREGDKWRMYLPHCNDFASEHESDTLAEEAAQADFERRLGECLVDKPVDVAAVRRQALEEAAKIAEKYDGMPCGAATGWPKDEIQHYMTGQQDASSSIAYGIRALSAEPAQGEQWQPITHLQLNGDEYLTWNGRRQHVARFDKVENSWVSSFTTVTRRLPISPQPTHFSPLPAAPTTEVKL